MQAINYKFGVGVTFKEWEGGWPIHSAVTVSLLKILQRRREL